MSEDIKKEILGEENPGERINAADLKRMSRKDLFELLYTMKLREEKLLAEIEKRDIELKDRAIKTEEAGNIAQASLAINGVFEAAQKAADDYLYSLQKANEERDALIAKANTEAEQILEEANQKAEKLLQNTQLQCAKKEEEITKRINAKIQNATFQMRELEKTYEKRIEDTNTLIDLKWSEFQEKMEQAKQEND